MGRQWQRAGVAGLIGLWAGGAWAASTPLDQADALYRDLVAEVAAARGDPALAGQLLYDLAKATRNGRIARRAALLDMQARDDARAAPALRLWHQLAPGDAQPAELLALLYVGHGQFDQAEPWLRQMLAKQPAQAGRSLLNLNNLLGQQPDHAGALGLLSRLAAPYDGQAEAHVAVAQAAWLADDYPRVAAEAARALALAPDNFQAAQLEGMGLQRQSHDQAAAFYARYLAAHPQADMVRLAYARMLAGDNESARARQQLDTLAAAAPHNADLALAGGMLLLEMKDGAGATRAFTRALKLGYQDPDAVRLALGEAAEQQQQYDQAAHWYEAAKATHPFDAALHLAALLGHRGQVDAARRALAALPVADEAQWAARVLAESRLLRDAHRDQEAFQVLDAALAQHPEDPDVLYEHALAADRIHRDDVCVQDLRKLVALQPDSAMALNALGYTLADKTTRYQEAYGLIDRALRLAPDDPLIKDSMGWVEYRLGRTAAAEKWLRAAWQATHDAEIGAHLGEVLWKLGHERQARDVLRRAAALHPDDTAPAEALRRLGAK